MDGLGVPRWFTFVGRVLLWLAAAGLAGTAVMQVAMLDPGVRYRMCPLERLEGRPVRTFTPVLLPGGPGRATAEHADAAGPGTAEPGPAAGPCPPSGPCVSAE